MIKKFFCFTAVFFLLSLSSAAENSGKDSRENLSSNAAKYSRIISLAPAAAKSLYQLGLDEEIAGITIYCPKGKSKKEIVGTLIEPDLEKIVSLKPDLIVASKEGNTKGFIEKLRLLKFNVFVMEMSDNFEDICSNFTLLAKEVGREKEAQRQIEKAKTELKSISARLANQKTASLFWEIGVSPLYTAGKKSFLNDYNKYSKTKNIFEDSIKGRYSPVDIEAVTAANPQIIICADMDGIDVKKEMKKWRKFPNMSAVKNGKIFAVDAYDFFSFTPLDFSKAVQLLTNLIYGEENR